MNQARRLFDASVKGGDLSQGVSRGIDVFLVIENGIVVVSVLSAKAVECR